jgi:tryptophanyl-tRNA synthetase
MTRDMVGYFNQQYLGSSCHDDDGHWNGKGLKRPTAVVREATGLVPGLDGRKMSKSYDNHVPIFGPKKALKKRIMSIVTDSTPLEDPKDPTNCNVFALFKLFSNEEDQAALAAKYRGGNFGYGHAKLELFEKSQEYFGPKQERFDALMADTEGLERVLESGAKKARVVAQRVLKRARVAMGLPSKLPFPGL